MVLPVPVAGDTGHVAAHDTVAGILNDPATNWPQGNATYVATTGAATGTADSAAIQAKLNLGGTVKLLTGQTYAVDTQLVIGSNTTLDLNGATLQRKSGVNGPLLVNTSFLTQRTVTDAAITSGGTTLTSATATFAAGDVGKNFTLTKASAAGGSVAGTITAYTNATTVTVSVTAGATVTNGILCVYGARDTNIHVIGPGTIDGANNAGTGGSFVGTTLHHVVFRHVDQFSIGGGITGLSTTGGKFLISLGDVSRFTVDGMIFNTHSDGCHIQGPASNFVVRNLKGFTGDDMCGVVPNDYATYNDVAGDIQQFSIEDLFPNQTSGAGHAVRLPAGLGCILRDGTVRNVFGVCADSPINIGDDVSSANTQSGRIDNMHFANILASPPDGAPTITLSPTNGGSFRVDGLTYDKSATNNNGIIHIETAGVVSALSITDLNVRTAAATCSPLRLDGTLTDLTVRGVRGTLGNYVVWVQGGAGAATLHRAAFSDIKCDMGGYGFVQAYNTTNTVDSIEVSNCAPTNCGGLFDLNTTTKIHVSSATTASGYPFAIRAATALSVWVDNCSLNGGINVITGGGSVASKSLGWQLDLSTSGLAKNNGDLAYNTNAGLSCGAGPVVSNGTAWKNLYTGSTY